MILISRLLRENWKIRLEEPVNCLPQCLKNCGKIVKVRTTTACLKSSLSILRWDHRLYLIDELSADKIFEQNWGHNRQSWQFVQQILQLFIKWKTLWGQLDEAILRCWEWWSLVTACTEVRR